MVQIQTGGINNAMYVLHNKICMHACLHVLYKSQLKVIYSLRHLFISLQSFSCLDIAVYNDHTGVEKILLQNADQAKVHSLACIVPMHEPKLCIIPFL